MTKVSLIRTAARRRVRKSPRVCQMRRKVPLDPYMHNIKFPDVGMSWTHPKE
jgi:hypothetical protein